MELSRAELEHRSIAGIASQLEVFSSGRDDSRAFKRDGVVASVVPACPARSLFNSVHYSDPVALRDALDELEELYAAAGVRAWTVWVPGTDRETADALSSRGHALDGSPRAMGVALAALGEAPPQPAGLEITVGEGSDAGRLNDLAYGYEAEAFAAALRQPTVPPVEWTYGFIDGEACGVVGAIEAEGDLVITAVATRPQMQGRGIAGAILHKVLRTGRDRGFESASLQASRAGAPLYRRLGFADLGGLEMWELRRGPHRGS
jgi:GNAT superfamily N-acetyltransferase